MTPRPITALAALMLIAAASSTCWGIQRFPPPDFTSHELPAFQSVPPRAQWQDVMDVVVLAAALGLATWLVHFRRSRRWMLGLTVFAVAYFGFYRLGCICPIGAIGNVTMAFSDATYHVPWVVVLFFVLPLAFGLVFGRVFCSGVCPLGAVQELVLIKRVRVPEWLDGTLRVVPFLYLGLAVLLAATASLLVICEYDPFVRLFRLAGVMGYLIFTGAAVGVSMFIARPYCRWLCPYGAILGCLSLVSWKTVSATPDHCIRCSLCDDACPYGAIRPPTQAPAEEEEPR